MLVEVELPTPIHERIVVLLGFFLHGWARPRRAGIVLGSGYKVRINPNRGVMPDVQFYRRDNPAPRGEQGLESGHPDLVVEVISPTSGPYDRVRKLGDYAAIGVPEYWIVDPIDQTLHRLVLEGGRYVVAEALAGDEVFRPESFEGLEIPLAELWHPEGG
jgi:Uma2 family endonuclease